MADYYVIKLVDSIHILEFFLLKSQKGSKYHLGEIINSITWFIPFDFVPGVLIVKFVDWEPALG